MRSTFQVKKSSGLYPRLVVDADGGSALAQAGGAVLSSTIRAAGLDVALREALAPWRPQLARHDPAKVLLDLALTLALGGDTCSDLATVRRGSSAQSPRPCWKNGTMVTTTGRLLRLREERNPDEVLYGRLPVTALAWRGRLPRSWPTTWPARRPWRGA